MQAGTESYGLKQMERLAGFERGHEIDRGAGAVVEYEQLDGRPRRRPSHARSPPTTRTTSGRPGRCATGSSTSARPTTPWRPAVLDKYEPDPELDARIEALHAFGPGTDEHLMGDLLGYWRREKSAVAADVLRLSTAPDADQMESLSAITRLTFLGPEPVLPKKGKVAKWPGAASRSRPPNDRRRATGRSRGDQCRRTVLTGGDLYESCWIC